jgi:hypothetical protein
MQLCSRESDSCTATKELFSIWWNPKVHYWIHKSFSLSIPQARPIQTALPQTTYPVSILILSTHFVLVLLVGSFPMAFLTTTYIRSSFSPNSCYIPRPSHRPWLYYSNYTWRRVQITKLLVCSFLHPPVILFFFCPNILFSTLFSNTLNLCSSLNVRDQVWQPYRTTGNIIVLYILIFTFFYNRREDKKFWTEW